MCLQQSGTVAKGRNETKRLDASALSSKRNAAGEGHREPADLLRVPSVQGFGSGGVVALR